MAAFDFGAQAKYVTAWASVSWHSGRPDELARLHGRDGQRQRVRIGIADVLAGKDHQPAAEKPHILAPFEHPRQPIEAGVGIAAADTLDQRTGGVVVVVACRIVADRLALDGVGDQFSIEPQCRWH